MPPKSPDCDSRHLRWAATIISIVLVVCAATVGYCLTETRALDVRIRTEIKALDIRVREVEKHDEANAARFEAIRESLRRLEGSAE